MREPGRRRDADRHRLAVGEATVAGAGLERVADGVAVVQHRPELGLLLVTLDDRGLDPARPGDHPLERRQIAREQRAGVPFDVDEVRRVGDDAVLDDLREAGAELPVGQRDDDVGIHEDEARLVEGADQVLGAGMVDRGLAADRGVHLGEDGRRELDEVEAAHVGGGHEPREVADGSAAERHHGGCPVDSGGEQLVPAPLGDGDRLRAFALGHHDLGQTEAGRPEALRHRVAV